MKDIINVIKVIAVIIGTIIGAGFASGKEIYIFFAQYGKYGIIGAIFSAILMAIIIYSTILIVKKSKVKNNNEFIAQISNKESMIEILKNIINIFLVVSFWIMCAGFCTFLNQEMGVPIIVTAIFNAIIVYILLMKKIDGVIKLNSVVVPIMITIIIMISIKNYSLTNLLSSNLDTNSKSLGEAILSAILFISYNSITLIPIITSINLEINNKKIFKFIAIISGIIIFILIIAIYQMLALSSINVKNMELPILEVLDLCHPIEKIIYSIAIVIAILTSAISSGYGALENLKEKDKYKKTAMLICLLEIPISYIGFGNLVSALYPVFGFIGILQIISILKKAISIAKNSKNWYKIYKKF